MQLAGLIGHFCRQVVALAQIVAQIVELEAAVFEELNERPVARANRAGGSGAPGAGPRAEITRKVPIDGVAVELGLPAALQQTRVARAVEGVVGGALRAREFEQRGRTTRGTSTSTHRPGWAR